MKSRPVPALSTNIANWPPDAVYLYRERVAICEESLVAIERAEEIAMDQVRIEYEVTP